MKNPMTRRDFVHAATALGAAAALPGAAKAQPIASAPARGIAPLAIHVFSKHLQFLDYDRMAAVAAEIGFAGVDLTVRPGGHVEPADAARDLPRAAAALRRHGLATTMLTTAITRADDPHCDAVFGAARDAGFRHVRLGWYRYPPEDSVPDVIAALEPQAAALTPALERAGLAGGFQNHAGEAYVGGSLWELWQLIDDLPSERIGVQYDIRHATVERGLSWSNELRLIATRIMTIVLKDFRWGVSDKGTPQPVNTPIGEGWVDFPRYFTMLRQFGLYPPASLHLEYPLGGANRGLRELSVPPETVYAAMRRDLASAQRLWAGAPEV